MRSKRRRLAYSFEGLESRRVLATVSQVASFETWNAGIVPSTDAAGITYYPSSGHLYLADSEINELPEFEGNNVFEISPTGSQLVREIATGNDEPTGIEYSQYDGYFYVTNDNTQLITRYDSSFSAPLAEVNVAFDVPTAVDPEGITSDPSTGFLYVADGIGGGKQVVVYDPDLTYQYRFSLADRMQDAEGIAFDPVTHHLFIVSDPDNAIFEYTLNGVYVDQYDIRTLSPPPKSPQGLTFAPTSDPFDDPSLRSLYIADAGVDNFPDGIVYEVLVSGSELAQNTAPLVDVGGNQTVLASSFPVLSDLEAAVADDFLPSVPGAVTTNWSQVSGPALVNFSDSTAVDTVAEFPIGGTYVLRLTASDGLLTTVQDKQVMVRRGAEVSVANSSDDAEERIESGKVTVTSGDLDLIVDSGSTSSYDQLVGMRFGGLTIPQGATIQNAYIQFRADETTAGPTSLVIKGHATDDAPTFTTQSGGISSRSPTVASASWNPSPWTRGDRGPDQQTPNIAAVVQEIVDRPGWSSGNALALIVSGSGERVAESFDGNYSSKAPLLHVEYSVAGVTISQTNGNTVVAEGGQADAYDVVLNTIPVADVTVTVTPDAQMDLAREPAWHEC